MHDASSYIASSYSDDSIVDKINRPMKVDGNATLLITLYFQLHLKKFL